MKTFRYGLFPLMIASTFGSAQAYEDDRIYLAPMASYALADDDRHSDDGLGGTLAVGFPMTPSFGLEVRGSYLKYKDTPDCNAVFGNQCDDDNNGKFWGAGAGVNWYLFGAGVGPYLHADLLAGEYTQYNAGLGFDIPLSDYIGIRAEALYHWQKANDDMVKFADFAEPLFNLGIRIPLGAKPVPPPPVAAVPPPPPPPPPPVCSDGLDNDGDGAIDFPADKGCTDAADMDEYNPICPVPVAGQPITLEGCAVGDTIVLQGVTFEFDKARLTPNAKIILDRVAGALEKRPDIKVEIGGHTDFKGSDSYNLSLSDRRSKSVMDYLVSKGIDAGRMTARGYGETMPVADNNTEEGRELNRRVELKVTESSGGGVIIAPTQPTAEFAQPLAPEAAPAPAAEPAPTATPAPEPTPAVSMETPAATAGPVTVTISDFAYSPATLTVKAGTTVTWQNKDGSNHFVNFAGESSGRLRKDAVYTKTFPSPGVYEYACQLHPTMKGTVVVE